MKDKKNAWKDIPITKQNANIARIYFQILSKIWSNKIVRAYATIE